MKGLGDEIRERMLDTYMRQRASSSFVNDFTAILSSNEGALRKNQTFNISNSNIGMLNSDSVIRAATAELDASINSIDEDASTALKSMLEFLASTQCGLTPRERNEAANLVGDLAKQMALPKDRQSSTGSIRLMINRIADLIKTSAAGSTLWQHWGVQLMSLIK
jgi:hypothetical protein